MVEQTPVSEGAGTGPRPAERVRPAERALASALRSAFAVLRVVMLVVLVALLFSNTRFLQQNQRAVILHFGKIVGTGARQVRGPGLVFAWPQPIDEIIVVDSGRTQEVEIDDFMYRKGARDGGTESLGQSLQTGLDGYTLTGDANIIHSIWNVRYRINDVVKYALGVEDPEALLRRTLAAAVVEASAEFDVEEALWLKSEALRRVARERLQERLDAADCGIKVDSLTTTALEEPRQTTEAFTKARRVAEDVGKQKQEAARLREKLLASVAGDVGLELARKLSRLADVEDALAAAEAAAEAAPEGAPAASPEAGMAALREEEASLRASVEELLDRASGTVATILNEARAYEQGVVKDAAARAAAFEELLEEFEKHPEILVRRLHAQMLEELLTQSGSKFFLYPRDEREIWIELEELRRKPTAEEEEPVVVKTEEERQRERMRGF